MFDIEGGVEVEIEPLRRWNSQAAQSCSDGRDSSWGSHLDDTQSSNRMVGVVAFSSLSDHQIAECERGPHGGINGDWQIEKTTDAFQQTTVHAGLLSASHFVPVITRHL